MSGPRPVSRSRRLTLAALALGLVACSGSTPPPATSSPPTVAPPATVTTVGPTTTVAPPTVAPPTTVTTVGPTTTVTTPAPDPFGPALPGRLPPVAAPDIATALYPTPVRFDSPLELAVDVIGRLRAWIESTGGAARLGGASLVSATGAPAQPDGSTMVFVIEVRNLEASGDDTTPGYDLAAYLTRDADGWSLAGVATQRICSRSVVPGDPPLCG